MGKPKRKLNLITSDIEEHKDTSGIHFSVHNLVSFSATERQQEFIDVFNKTETPFISMLGSPGTGKTVTALYQGILNVLDKSTPYEKVVIIRSAVSGRDVGFLPGGADTNSREGSKFTAYEAPYESLFDEILTYKSNNYSNLKAKNLVQFESTSFLRGQTFNDAIVVVDECQSMTFKELYTIITRIGINSRIVLCGDYKQDDLGKKKNDVSGLGDIMSIIDHMPEGTAHTITFTWEDIVRSGFVKDFIVASEKAGY